MSHVPGSGNSENLEPNLTPLLDVVLQLIMFFMITVNFVARDQFNKKIQLPKAQVAANLDQAADNWVFLNMDSDGNLLVRDGKLDTPSKLKAYVERERRDLERRAQLLGRTEDINVVIVLRADKEARYHQVWEALDSCMRAGYSRWQLRVEYKSPQKKT
jgi:biopolymer transport protein ExbD